MTYNSNSPICCDDEVGVRLKALREQRENVCYARIYPRPPGSCWCHILKQPGEPDIPCPPSPTA